MSGIKLVINNKSTSKPKQEAPAKQAEVATASLAVSEISIEDAAQQVKAGLKSIDAVSDTAALSALFIRSKLPFGILVETLFKQSILTPCTSLPLKETGLKMLISLAKHEESRAYEATFSTWIPLILELASDRAPSIQTLSNQALAAIGRLINTYMVPHHLPIVFGALEKSNRWSSRVAALDLLNTFTIEAPSMIAQCLEELVPQVGDCMSDIKPQVAKSARETMSSIMKVVGNRDIEAITPKIVDCIGDPTAVSKCIRALSETTFVSDVEAPTLSVICPILLRALSTRGDSVQTRQTCVIIHNMFKLVPEPDDIINFIPPLLPGLETIAEMGADPELRDVTHATLKTLKTMIENSEKIEHEHHDSTSVDLKTIREILVDETGSAATTLEIDYASELVVKLLNARNFDSVEWQAMQLYLSDFPKFQHAQLRQRCMKLVKKVDHVQVDGNEVLCNTEFSLGYGSRILLKKARLKLIRGYRYGLLGKNGCGKSTLLRSISNGQLDGFPSPDDVRTAYVSHKFQGVRDEKSVVLFLQERFPDTDVADLKKVLSEIGFTEALQERSVGALSGGWKMKLDIVMAMVKNADILLLDEPTNHLDEQNVAWLEQFIKSKTHVTAIIVSHSDTFLENVCTHIIHYETKQLRTYHMGFYQFVESVPEAKNYMLQDAEDATSFKFPDPGNLDGVKSRDRKVMKLKNVSFTYPGTQKPSLFDINFGVTLSSRIAVVGQNGSGKSTLIKCLTGETAPTTGEQVTHPSLRVSIVAQHAFHHLSQHLDTTPNAYIRWRFEHGQDKELFAKDSRAISEAETKAQEDMNIELLCGRQKVKRSYKYEVKFVGRPFSDTRWETRERLEELGFSALIQRYDDHEAARGGNMDREITVAAVEKHLDDFSIGRELGTHTRIGGLSDGQKVKVVLAAATWLKPHILVMDEPTNYLDMMTLNALAAAIKEFKGAVVVISHNDAFIKQTCTEIWKMDAGRLTLDGQPPKEVNGDIVETAQPDLKLDESLKDPENARAGKGVRKARKETRAERIKKEKTKAVKLAKYGPKKDGTPYSSDEEPADRHIHI